MTSRWLQAQLKLAINVLTLKTENIGSRFSSHLPVREVLKLSWMIAVIFNHFEELATNVTS